MKNTESEHEGLFVPHNANKCPFCSAEPSSFKTDKGYTILCSGNGCRTIVSPSLEEAVKLWNEPKTSH
mgnify:CR=1 FL=1